MLVQQGRQLGAPRGRARGGELQGGVGLVERGGERDGREGGGEGGGGGVGGGERGGARLDEAEEHVRDFGGGEGLVEEEVAAAHFGFVFGAVLKV